MDPYLVRRQQIDRGSIVLEKGERENANALPKDAGGSVLCEIETGSL